MRTPGRGGAGGGKGGGRGTGRGPGAPGQGPRRRPTEGHPPARRNPERPAEGRRPRDERPAGRQGPDRRRDEARRDTARTGERRAAGPQGGARRTPERRTTEPRTERPTPDRRAAEGRATDRRAAGPPPGGRRPPERRAERPPERPTERVPAGPRKPPKPPAPTAPASPGLAAALDYLGRGWSVIPLQPGDKRPLVPWEEYQYRRPAEAVVRSWFRRSPDAGVGIVTGLASGLVVLDVDAAHGGEASLQRLVQAHGELPWTVEARTGGGGRHLYFTHPGGVIHNRAGFRPGLDLRGDGGYVVAPPSVHPSGRPYTWAPTGDPQRAQPAPLPAWLLHTVAPPPGRRTGHPREHWRRLVSEGVAQGERNTTVASLTGHLLFRGVDPEVALELLLCWNRVRCRPPLPDDEVARTVESILRTHARQAGEEAPEGSAPAP